MAPFARSPVAEFLSRNKTWLLSWSAIVTAVVLVVTFWPQPPSPVPALIRAKASFSVIYPQDYRISSSSWEYLTSEQAVQFAAKSGASTVVFTEEKTPLRYQDDDAAYNRFVGSLRPRANFDVPLGTVSISNFVTQGSYQVVGETGILKVKDTMVFAHPDRQISDDDWRNLFQSLRVDN